MTGRREAEAALRAEAERTGRSQQDILREAVGIRLGLIPGQAGDLDPLITCGRVAPPRVPSALLKRIVEEPESGPLVVALRGYADERAPLLSSCLASIEVSWVMSEIAEYPVGGDLFITYDDRTGHAGQQNGLRRAAPGRC